MHSLSNDFPGKSGGGVLDFSGRGIKAVDFTGKGRAAAADITGEVGDGAALYSFVIIELVSPSIMLF